MEGKVGLAAVLARESEEVRRRSLELGIPSIEPSDGLLLYTLAFTAASLHHRGIFVDAGAGIGYSTIWIAAGVRQAGCRECIVYAVEYDEDLAREAERILASLESIRGVNVRVVAGDALDFLSRAREVAMLFLDIEKHEYPKAIELGYKTMLPRGALAVHNAFYPPPPPETFQVLDELGFEWMVAPTGPGLIIAWKTG